MNDSDFVAVLGQSYWFEYHCNESHDSPDAPVWYRSHQRVTVLSADNLELLDEFPTFNERMEAGESIMYRVRFEDGLEWDVFEDELMKTTEHFSRPNPPKELTP